MYHLVLHRHSVAVILCGKFPQAVGPGSSVHGFETTTYNTAFLCILMEIKKLPYALGLMHTMMIISAKN
jgi:hypothetical protein